MSESAKPILTRYHPDWNLFMERLARKLSTRRCGHSTRNAWALLIKMGFDAAGSLAYFSGLGAECDCEILKSVAQEESTADHQPEPCPPSHP